MRSRSIAFRSPRYSTLSVSLALSLGISLPLTASSEAYAHAAPVSFPDRSADSKTSHPWPSTLRAPHPTSISHTVNTCADDDSPGSLRAIIESPNTGDGDTIDMTQLPMGCSTITLDDATHVPSYIKIAQRYLHLVGPGIGQLTIDGGYHSSVLRHVGYGTLEIEGMTIANAKYVSDNSPFGGCVYSKGTVDLESSRLEHCRAAGTSTTAAEGGGVFASIGLTMYRSSITDSGAFDTQDTNANGGGAFVGNLTTTYATISGNYASGAGGGAYVEGDSVTISSSTISSNRAQFGGGLYLSNSAGNAKITDSTISGNDATTIGGLLARGDLKLLNSTIAFNRNQSYATIAAGLYAAGASLSLESSIIAGNGGAGGPADLWTNAATMVSGSHNLIVAGISIPAGTIRDCPQLDPLANNGGPTLTHAIRHASPAIDAGSNPENLLFDQTGYLRVEGIAADIGAFEWRAAISDERVFAGGFDGLCDQ